MGRTNMRMITIHDGQLQDVLGSQLKGPKAGIFTTGLPAIDSLFPAGGLARGAVHELLAEPGITPMFVAAVMGRNAKCQMPNAELQYAFQFGIRNSEFGISP